ncbi:MAG: hypothetical protein ACTSP4_01225 [Candidatus Hodarchaeales archaeon]
MKELIPLVQDNFANYLKKQVSKSSGISPRKIDVKDVVFKENIGNHNQLALYECLFSSEIGFHSCIFGLKRFQSIYKATKEANGSFLLREMLQNDDKTHTLELLHFSYELKTIIYEYPSNGFIDKFKQLNEFRRYYLAGRALPHIHGLQGFNQVDVDGYLKRFDSAINSLDSDPEFKDKIRAFLSDRAIRWRVCMAGARSYGWYTEDSVLFQDSPQKEYRSGDGEIDRLRIYLIHPGFINNLNTFDRLEDICTYLLDPALNSYKNTGNLDKVFENVVFLINGYNSGLENVLGIQLQDLYKEGLPVNLQLILACLEGQVLEKSEFTQDSSLKKQFIEHVMENPIEI